MLKYNITYGGLSSQEIGAHIHTGAVGSEGPIAFTLPEVQQRQEKRAVNTTAKTRPVQW